MELDLGLALPSHFPIKSSDLNCNIIDSFDDNFSEPKNDINHNPSFSMASDNSNKVERKTLPLLIWNDQPNEEEEDDDDGGGHQKGTFEACYREFKEENGVVGWPPIKSWRKKIIHGINDEGGWNTNINRRHINNDVGRYRNSMYVKVKMEGVAIGRKIDLSLYNSYQLLTNTLLQMFAKYQSGDKNGAGFTLLYQDKEGDWMLAGDVPWDDPSGAVRRSRAVPVQAAWGAFSASVGSDALQNIHGDCSKNTDTKELEERKKYEKIIRYFLNYYNIKFSRPC